jgi:hypothetical protein
MSVHGQTMVRRKGVVFLLCWHLYSASIEAGFEVLTAVSRKIAVFWIVARCSLVELLPDYTALQPNRSLQ